MRLDIELGDYHGLQYSDDCDLYLVPEEEYREEGAILVCNHGGVGNTGTPMPAYHGRWLCIGGHHKDVVLDDLVDWLRARKDELIELAGHYQGTEWDGSNHIGKWDLEDEDVWGVQDRIRDDLERDIADDIIGSYWDAAEWLSTGTTPDNDLHQWLLMSDDDLEAAAVALAADAASDGAHLDVDDLVEAMRAEARDWADQQAELDAEIGREP